MSWLDRVAALVSAPAEVQAAVLSTGTDTGGTTTAPAVSTFRARNVARNVAMSIPAVRKARAALLTIATFRLAPWDADGYRLSTSTPGLSFLEQWEPRRTMYRSLAMCLDDAIWHDRSVWKIERDIAKRTAYLERVHPDRIGVITDPRDPDTVETWLLDGRPFTESELTAGHVVFDWAGMGGLKRLGLPLLELYGDLQAAAGRYARAPHPHAILKNAGPSLDDDEIDELLDEWEAARAERGTGYIEGAIEHEAVGYSAKDLQLVEAREHSALEVARLFGLPARSVDAKSGDPLTYSTVVENRRDLLEAFRPWMTPITQGLSLNDRLGTTSGLVVPRNVSVEFDADAYLRDDPASRMTTWAAGVELGLWTTADIARMEPLARKARP